MTSLLNRWLTLAMYVSTGSILVFAHGFAGAGSIFTSVFISVSTLALFLSSRWHDFAIDACDLLFAALLCFIAISIAVNGIHGDYKETALLLLSFGAYPSARLFAGSKMIAPIFLICTAAIVMIGAALTVLALPAQWSNSFGRPHPVVFGEFGAAPLQFTMSLGFLMIALVCTRLTGMQATAAGLLVTMLTIIFAVAFVRFTFVAIGVALLFAWATSPRSARRYAGFMILLLVAGVIIGTATRIGLATGFSDNIPALAPAQIPLAVPARTEAGESARMLAQAGNDKANSHGACPTIDLQDSIAIRRQLYVDAFANLPKAGLFGIGMDNFMVRSCISDSEIHNSILQTAVEFGWIGAIVLTALLVVSGCSLWRFAQHCDEARFALCALIFVVVLSMAHGRISRDALLFLFLGYAASLRARRGIRPQLTQG